jgi:K+-sensing histidine kinase KdpD
VQITDASTSSSFRPRSALRDAGLWFVLLALAGTTLLHYLTDVHFIPYHSIYRSLYYLPIAVAAVRYGRWGGVLTALTASLLFIPHVILSWKFMPIDGFNDLFENLIFLFVGILVGSLADAERRQRRRTQATATQLAATNKQLQAQATLAERMRASIASILESVDSGVITLDPNGQITTVNRAAQGLLGGTDQRGPRCPLRSTIILQRGRVAIAKLRLRGACLGCTARPSLAGRVRLSASCSCWTI